jgi:hypothetical protein
MLLFIVLGVANSLSCESFGCIPSSAKLSSGTCASSINETVYIQECSNGQVCNLNTSLCEDPEPESIGIRYPGESCKASTDCYSNVCTNKICTGYSAGASCELDEDCNPGLRCSDSVCARVLNEGESGCEDDYDCINSAGCNLIGKTGICTKYLSVSIGSYVSDCSGGSSLLCKSAECYKSNTFATTGVCKPATVSVSELPVACTADLDCVGSDNKFEYTGDCSCGYNNKATAYCSPFNGDMPGLVYYQSWKNALNASEGVCNTVRRFDPGCLEQTGYYKKITQVTWEFYNYPEIQNNDICVESMINYEYYDILSFGSYIGIIFCLYLA